MQFDDRAYDFEYGARGPAATPETHAQERRQAPRRQLRYLRWREPRRREDATPQFGGRGAEDLRDIVYRERERFRRTGDE